MWYQRLISRNCCGGLVLVLTLMCISMGVLFLTLSTVMPGLVLIVVGLLTEAVCLTMSRTRCIDGIRSR